MIAVSYFICIASGLFWFFFLENNIFSKSVGLILILISLRIFSKGSKEKLWILSLSPILWAFGATSPKHVLIIFLLILEDCFFSVANWKKYLLGIFTLFLWSFLTFSNVPLSKIINFNNSATEVNQRFEEEYFLNNKIYFPKIEEKIAYNRYFFAFKNFIREGIKIFDFDFIFFQESNPQFKNSLVMFSWIWIWVFFDGLINFKSLKNKGNFWWWILISVVYFYLSNGYWFQRQVLMVFPIAIIISHGCENLKKYKVLYLTVLILSLYAAWLNYMDLAKNKSYWLEGLTSQYEQIK